MSLNTPFAVSFIYYNPIRGISEVIDVSCISTYIYVIIVIIKFVDQDIIEFLSCFIYIYIYIFITKF